MICEHWKVDEDYNGPEEVFGGDCVSTPEFFTNPNNAALNVGLKRCCTIEGKDWEEVMTKYHEHMGFEPYIPF